jgi:hypothetical protein
MQNMKLGFLKQWRQNSPILHHVCFPPWAQQNRCMPIESMGWLHMHQEKS